MKIDPVWALIAAMLVAAVILASLPNEAKVPASTSPQSLSYCTPGPGPNWNEMQLLMMQMHDHSAPRVGFLR